MPKALFIYWKLDAGRTAEATAAASRLQAGLQARHPGLQAGLYRRADVPGGVATLMETYAHPAGVEAPLQAAIEADAAVALQDWCTGPRHVEVFESIAP